MSEPKTYAKVIADTVAPHGVRITTLEVCFHRWILPEFNTHRVFSRNFRSSRAVPVKKLIEEVRNNPAMPVHWGKNQPGMQANEEHKAVIALQGVGLGTKEVAWLEAALNAAEIAENFDDAGYHKQIVNRLLEPFLYTYGVVTSTEWDNFFALRDHPDAQPEIRLLAQKMREAIDQSTPREATAHIPYADTPDWTIKNLWQSVARCARVSVKPFDEDNPSTIEKDRELYAKLLTSNPAHASPFEHQAISLPYAEDYHKWRNFRGWQQHRDILGI